MYICPRCIKSRPGTEKIVHKDGKEWLILYCHFCNWNFDITEWNDKAKAVEIEEPPRKPKRFRLGPDRDEE